MKRYLLLLGVALWVPLVFFGVNAVAEDAVEHGGDIIYTKPLKAVIFSHKAHVEDIGLECDWCHAETFEMEALNMQENTDFTMESLCNENYCGTCHNGDISFSTTTQCARCHIGVKGYNEMVRQGKIKPEEGDEVEVEGGEHE
jgi:c(7)-type cytochrome triheme protein